MRSVKSGFVFIIPKAILSGKPGNIEMGVNFMKKLSGMVLGAVLVLCSHPAFAMTGADLVDGMKSYLKSEKNYTKTDYLLTGNYLGYVQGVAEATASDYSLPKDITPNKLCHIVANYLEKHPEKMNEPAVSIVRAALREAFPVFIIKNR